jgi:hypothetical protein
MIGAADALESAVGPPLVLQLQQASGMMMKWLTRMAFTRMGGWGAVGYYAWKNRDKIKEIYGRVKREISERVAQGSSYGKSSSEEPADQDSIQTSSRRVS